MAGLSAPFRIVASTVTASMSTTGKVTAALARAHYSSTPALRAEETTTTTTATTDTRGSPDREKKSLPPSLAPYRTISRQRRMALEWLHNYRRKWEDSMKSSSSSNSSSNSNNSSRQSSYLGPHENQPFPMNPLFRSQPVLDERAREYIWGRIVVAKEPLKVISAELGVDVRRVAAVVRLKEIEKRWVREGKKLATPYSKAILKMVPTTSYHDAQGRLLAEPSPHEPINDIHVHGYTMQQIFLPTSESRHFTREDAALAFHPKMLSPDIRTSNPELIAMQKRILGGENPQRALEQFQQEAQSSEAALEADAYYKKAREARSTERRQTDRFEFRFRNFDSERVGHDGRDRRAVGVRYGAPLQDRKRGQVKIPTSVP